MSQLSDAIAMAKTASSRAMGAQQSNPFEDYLKQAAEQACSGQTTMEDLGLAKQAAVELYQDAYDQYSEAVEKLAFAEQLYVEAHQVEKTAADNGPGEQMAPYIDQLHTPAGASLAPQGNAVAGVANAIRGGASALGAHVVASAGALNAFLEQKRMARANGLLAANSAMPQMPGSLPQ